MAKQWENSNGKINRWEYLIIGLIWILAISLIMILIAKVRFALN